MKVKQYIIIFIVIFITILAGYFACKRENNTNATDIEQAKQKAIDSVETYNYKQLIDSLTIENKALSIAYNSISKFKKVTKQEINVNNKKINALSDSSVQRYLDSIRSAGLR